MLITKWQNSIKEKRARYLASKPRPDQIKDYADDPKFKKYLDELYQLRLDGEIKLAEIQSQIRDVKCNKRIDKFTKKKMIDELNNQAIEAKIVIAKDKHQICKIVWLKKQLLRNKFKKDCAAIGKLRKSEKAKNKLYTELKNKFIIDTLQVQKLYKDEKIKRLQFRKKEIILKADYENNLGVLVKEYNNKTVVINQKYSEDMASLNGLHEGNLDKIKATTYEKPEAKEADIAIENKTYNNAKALIVKARKDQLHIAKVDFKTKKGKLHAKLEKDIENAFNQIVGEIDKIERLVFEATTLSKIRYKDEFKSVKYDNANKKLDVIEKCNKELAVVRDNHNKNVQRIKNSTFKNKADMNAELQNEKNSYEAQKSSLIISRNNSVQQLKQNTYACFLASYNYNYAVRNNKHSVRELWAGRWQHFKANFDLLQFLAKYALYMIIVIIFIALVIAGATKGVQLLSGRSILTAFQQIAPKIFFSLGAACLILLGGTDLSIGRLTGIGVSFTLMALSSTSYADNNGVVWLHTASMPGGARVIVALLLSISICTLFSTFSGFFTAKFKIHPFITTLATQLISYGIFQIFWSGTSTFSPAPADAGLMNGIRGAQGWQLILYAVIAIAIVWFIWNKTKFGKNLYAVGGNQEAAKVSGINPFIITLLAFVMAGVLYGCGGFVQAAQAGTGNFTTGYGTETDAIAACVIGGISFTGGIGKVSGAVIGTVVLGFLTFAFSSMGMDSNLQLVIKGFIIILAVTLDCVKYLKRK